MKGFGASYAVVTGGEPMIAPEIAALTRELRSAGNAHHDRNGRNGVRMSGLRPDEHQPEAQQLDAGGSRFARSTSGCDTSRRCLRKLMDGTNTS